MHDYKCMLVKYGMERKIWVKRRMVGHLVMSESSKEEEEAVDQNTR